MLYSRLAAVLCLGLSVFAVAACSDDPGSVGAELGSNPLSDGAPNASDFVVSSTSTESAFAETGFASEENEDSWRVLTGTVNDQVEGEPLDLDAEGYIDFNGTVDPPDALASASDDDLDADLLLTRSYVHGNTSDNLSVELYDLEEADMEGAQADETFPIDGSSPITSVSFSPTASEVTISLDDWIDARQSDLSGSSFSNLHGFRLTTTSGNAVVGFEHASAALRVTTSSDTATFPANQSFTNITPNSLPPSPLSNDKRLLLDGVGRSLSFNWANDSALNERATKEVNDRLNRAAITIPVDTGASSGGNFVRPAPSGYRILGIRNDDSPECAEVGTNSELVFRTLPDGASACGVPTDNTSPTEARTTASAGLALFGHWFSNGRPFSEFRVEVANRGASSPSSSETTRPGLPGTVPVVVQVNPSTADTSALPRALFTTTPL